METRSRSKTKVRIRLHSHNKVSTSKVRWGRMQKQIEPLTCVNDIKNLIQQSMKEKGINAKQARKSLGIKRYEK